MRLDRPTGQLEALIQAAREEIVKRFNNADDKDAAPEEATILVETRAVLVIGGPLKRSGIKADWLNQQSARLTPEAAKQLRQIGATHGALVMSGGHQFHTIHEVVEIHLTEEAVSRLAERRNELAAQEAEANAPTESPGAAHENPSV